MAGSNTTKSLGLLFEKNERVVLEVEGKYNYTKEIGNRERERFRISITPPKKEKPRGYFPDEGRILISSCSDGFRKFEFTPGRISFLWKTEHWCGASGFGLGGGDYCPACDAFSDAEYVWKEIAPQLKEKGYIGERQ